MNYMIMNQYRLVMPAHHRKNYVPVGYSFRRPHGSHGVQRDPVRTFKIYVIGSYAVTKS